MGLKKPNNWNLSVAAKVAAIILLDVLGTAISFFLGLWFRADFAFENIRDVHLAGYLSAIGPWCAITIVVFACFRLYSSIWAFVSTS